MATTKTINDYSAAGSIDASNDYLLIEQSSVYNKINRTVYLGINGSPVGTTDTQALTNKTLGNTNTVILKDTLFTVQDDGDATKQLQFQLSGITTGNTRTLTVPDASTTLVGTGTTQTLTNKTITSPTITGGTYDNGSITVDSISGHTTGTIVTVANLQISNGVLNTNNSVVTANIANDAVTAPKMTNSGTWDSTWSWTTWVPNWTNLTIGNGTTSAYYTQIGKTVFVRIRFVFGSTSSIGGTTSVSLPVTAVSTYSTNFHGIGGGTAWDSSASAAFPIDASLVSTTSARLLTLNAAGTSALYASVTTTLPMTWATSDEVAISFSYEAA